MSEEAKKSKTSISKEILIPTLVLFLIALISTLLLGLVNNVTKDRIAAEQAATEAAARKSVFTQAADFQKASIDGTEYYIAKAKDGSVLGYVFNTSNKGYGGQVTATVGIDMTGKITGVVPGDLSNETPGLGQNGSKPSFLEQFVGKSGTIAVVKNGPTENEIQALTSATTTSTAITNDVNDAQALFAKIAKTGTVVTSASQVGGVK